MSVVRLPAAGDRHASDALCAWFRGRGWLPSPFQRETWTRYLRGESGLLITPTGSGKTLAAFGGPLLQAMHDGVVPPAPRVLWVTPLRALANDTARALREPIEALQPRWTVAIRTGDAGSRDRRLVRTGRADVVVITPESLALLLTYPDAAARLTSLRCVIVDEWHELLGNKRGVLLQLCVARLRALNPQMRTWGLSATLGNPEQARDTLVPRTEPFRPAAAIVRGGKPRPVRIETLLAPVEAQRFAWAGQMGLAQLDRVMGAIGRARTSLVFTNTRAQAELWHRALQSIWLYPPDTLALHHGSIAPKLREAAEQGLRDGRLRCVIATSSLDLGVDFPAVDQVFQIGSPKGIARLMQRAGRAKHRPGEAARLICVPTNTLEVLEYAAARRALAAGRIEPRWSPVLSFDVLAQHCVTLALGGGFDAQALLREVRGTHAFAALTDADWRRVLRLIVQGGEALAHYPNYRKVTLDDDGRYRVHDRGVALRHRLSIGTIANEGGVTVKMLKGATLGTVEEGFIGRLRPGERFQFAGRTLELARLHEMTAYVRSCRRADGVVSRWQGGRMPMSSELGAELAALLDGALDQVGPQSPEVRFSRELLTLQLTMSALPRSDRLLAEFLHRRDGWHLFLYPFAGRAVHEGLAALLALRWARRVPNSFAFAVNDYGLVLSAQAAVDIDTDSLRELLRIDHLHADLQAGVNMTELARRQFREIARVAGLLPPSLPGKIAPSVRQLQVSSGLLFDVLTRFDAGHLLLELAEREVFERQLALTGLRTALERLAGQPLQLCRPSALSPFGFALWAEAVRGRLSTEDWSTRVQRAAQRLERRYHR